MQEITMARKTAAYKIHMDIMAAGEVAAESFSTFCRLLKTMRDDKLYAELEYSSFEDYCENAVGLKKSQAYAYIKTFEDFGKENSTRWEKLGIGKLKLLGTVPEESRDTFIDENKLKDMTTRQIEVAVKEWKTKLNETKRELDDTKKDLTLITRESSKIEGRYNLLLNDNRRLQEVNEEIGLKVVHSKTRYVSEFNALVIDISSYINSIIPKAKFFCGNMGEEEKMEACNKAISEIEDIICKFEEMKEDYHAGNYNGKENGGL